MHSLKVDHLKLKVISLALIVIVVILAAVGLVLSSVALNKHQTNAELILHKKVTQKVEKLIQPTSIS